MRVSRIANNGAGLAYAYHAVSGLTQYAPYCFRAMIGAIRGTVAAGVNADSAGLVYFGGDTAATPGMRRLVGTALITSSFNLFVDNVGALVSYAGDYYEVPYASFARCALADKGTNLLLRSDEFENTAAWGAINSDGLSSVTTNAATAPDGAGTAEALVENSSNSNHVRDQAVTVPATTNVDYAFSVAVRQSARSWVNVAMNHATGSCSVYVNLNTGAKGSAPAGSGWSNLRTFVVDLGANWYYICIVAKKTSADTTIFPAVYCATADGVNSYLGTGATAIFVWRATLAQSSVPTRLVQTTSAATIGVGATGSAIWLKGLPASTAGLLEIDDQVEIVTSRGSELKIVTARLSSDASGLGYLQFEPPLRGTPADNAAVIVHQPMGRFVYAGDSLGWDNDPGYMSSASCEFEESPS